ncbi:Uncharacterised protein [uncultured archaeon]|nr:Uncharacterised protein [uncultured archaeon]
MRMRTVRGLDPMVIGIGPIITRPPPSRPLISSPLFLRSFSIAGKKLSLCITRGKSGRTMLRNVNYRALKDAACDYDNIVSHLAG